MRNYWANYSRMVSTSCVLDSAMERVMELDIKVDVLLILIQDFLMQTT
jgi:hypothetical protein